MTRPRVVFEPDGTVSVTTGKVELGQGIATALAQIAAEELDVPLERIRMRPPSTAWSPDEGVTSGSMSIQDGGRSLREACAAARARAPKPAASYTVVGTSARRLDLPAKLTGRPSYVQDLVLPGMLHGRVVRPPRIFGRLLSVPELAQAKLVRDGNFLGVLAEREEQAIAAAAKLRAQAAWEAEPALPADIHDWLKRNVTEVQVAKEAADAAARARGTRRFSAAYRKPYLAHASIGPSCALAQWTGESLEVWTHSQGIFGLRQDLAKVLRTPEERITVHHVEGAGCYGHNGADDAALDAALLARVAGGRPVRLQWMREDEFAWEPWGTAMLMELEAGLDDAGNVVSWRHDLTSNAHTHRPGRAALPTLHAAAQIAEPFELSPAQDPPLPSGGAHRNAVPGYEFPDLLVRNHYVREMPIRSSSLRSLGASGNVFAIESFMDELAQAAGADPVDFRLRHLKDPRARAVIEAAASAAGFASFRKAEGRGRGIAYARYKNVGAYCAVVAEVDAGRELRVTRLVAAVDVGLAVNPDGVVNQVEGGCIQATSWALKEGTNARPASWDDYPILRFSEVPAVEVVLLPSSQPSLGAGECTMGPVIAAIANALHDALGVRVREFPFTPERIIHAIG